MLNPAGGTALTPEKLETAAAEKYVILKGCMANSLKKAKQVNYDMRVSLSNIKNPYAVRHTSPFKMEIYGAYDSGTNVLSSFIA